MRETRQIMGMPVTLELSGLAATADLMENVFAYFVHVDSVFSTYKPTSEISKLNDGTLNRNQLSAEVQEVLRLSEETKQVTQGFFDIDHEGKIDPSGLVKGWAVSKAATMLEQAGVQDFFVEAGGDIEVAGLNAEQQAWRVGIRNPFQYDEYVKILNLKNCGIATSGTSMRGQHVYNPHTGNPPVDDIVSLTVVGSNCYEADRFATAAFAMGRDGIHFIDGREGLAGYMIDAKGMGTATRNFSDYLA